MTEARILVVDDEHLDRGALEQNLRNQGYEVLTAATGEAALQTVREAQPDLVLLDVQLPGISGLEVLERIKAFDEEISVIMVTEDPGVGTAVNAMRMGACHYLNKPVNFEEMAVVIKKALENADLRREAAGLRNELRKVAPPTIIGNGPQMRHLLQMLGRVAKSEAVTVLIQGESGTGKELVAKWIHYESNRVDRPFVAINCAALPATLLESELFGYEKGAFTDAKTTRKGLLELADGGTVFLDEIGEMELDMQAKLLRFLEDRTFRRVGGTKVISVDVRIVAATNKDLPNEVAEKQFRGDLYYRLQVIPITLLPLRERKDDILPLADHFIQTFGREFNKRIKGISRAAANVLTEYRWPGNIRELKNVIERAVILGDEETLLTEHLPPEIMEKLPVSTQLSRVIRLPPDGIDIEEVEKDLIRQALELSGGSLPKAARKLNLSLESFRYRMKKFGYLA